jgi:hypothetical protein
MRILLNLFLQLEILRIETQSKRYHKVLNSDALVQDVLLRSPSFDGSNGVKGHIGLEAKEKLDSGILKIGRTAIWISSSSAYCVKMMDEKTIQGTGQTDATNATDETA